MQREGRRAQDDRKRRRRACARADGDSLAACGYHSGLRRTGFVPVKPYAQQMPPMRHARLTSDGSAAPTGSGRRLARVNFDLAAA